MKPQKNMTRPTENDLLKLLQDIEKRKIGITLDEKTSSQAKESENGIYVFETSNKWRIGVFVDCGQFDYIDHLQHGGTMINGQQLCKYYPKLEEFSRRYRNLELGKKVWGIESKLYAQI